MESPLRDDLRLIETMLWDGARYPRLAGHMARLARSAEELVFRCDPAEVRRALSGQAAEARRVRLTLGRRGDVEVTSAPLPRTAARWRITVAEERLDPGDWRLAHKTTERGLYDAARAALPRDIDEAIFLNRRDEVCEGTITNLFFDIGAGLATPPLACGCLPGVLRAELLALGVCREDVLPARELGRARLWVGNALRGLIAAELGD